MTEQDFKDRYNIETPEEFFKRREEEAEKNGLQIVYEDEEWREGQEQAEKERQQKKILQTLREERKLKDPLGLGPLQPLTSEERANEERIQKEMKQLQAEREEAFALAQEQWKASARELHGEEWKVEKQECLQWLEENKKFNSSKELTPEEIGALASAFENREDFFQLCSNLPKLKGRGIRVVEAILLKKKVDDLQEGENM